MRQKKKLKNFADVKIKIQQINKSFCFVCQSHSVSIGCRTTAVKAGISNFK